MVEGGWGVEGEWNVLVPLYIDLNKRINDEL